MQWLNRGRKVKERVRKRKIGFKKTRTYRLPKKLSPGPIDFPATLGEGNWDFGQPTIL